jgi:hypothetical protein
LTVHNRPSLIDRIIGHRSVSHVAENWMSHGSAADGFMQPVVDRTTPTPSLTPRVGAIPG